MSRALFATLFACATLVASGSALAQEHREQGRGVFKAPSKATGTPERRAVEPQRSDPRRPERMSPEDREKLRRDIEDANRRMERRR